jgi:hypothetical protein
LVKNPLVELYEYLTVKRSKTDLLKNQHVKIMPGY